MGSGLSAFKGRAPLNQLLSFWLSLFVVVLGSIIFFKSYSSKKPAKYSFNSAIPIMVAAVQMQDVPIYLTALGTVTPTLNITIKPQVSGQLLQILFREGQQVKKGELLAHIDEAPFKAQYKQYEGQLLRDQALLTNAKMDLQRYQNLWKKNAIAKQTLDTQRALVKQYEGAIKSDEGLLALAKVNLNYCRILSPISGRIGFRFVDPGNIVQVTDANGIGVVNAVNPINVIFSLPEDNIPQIINRMKLSAILPVQAFNRQQTKLLANGQLLTMDNQIDPTTGTVKLKAEFENKQDQLFPNQFVNVRLWVDTLKRALVIPTRAIKYTPSGPLVYVFNHNHVLARHIKTSLVIEDKTVVTEGLQEKEKVVTEGIDKLSAGSAIRVVKG